MSTTLIAVLVINIIILCTTVTTQSVKYVKWQDMNTLQRIAFGQKAVLERQDQNDEIRKNIQQQDETVKYIFIALAVIMIIFYFFKEKK